MTPVIWSPQSIHDLESIRAYITADSAAYAGTRKCSYVWAPPHFEQFVDRCAEQIRTQLRRRDISRDEMLSALVGMPFTEFVESCRTRVREGRMEPFE